MGDDDDNNSNDAAVAAVAAVSTDLNSIFQLMSTNIKSLTE